MFNNNSTLFKKLSLFVLCASIATSSNATPYSISNAYKLGVGLFGTASSVCWFYVRECLKSQRAFDTCNETVKLIQDKLNVDAQFSGDEDKTIKEKIFYPKVIAKLTPALARYHVWLMAKPDPKSDTQHAQECRAGLAKAKKEVRDLVEGLPSVNNKSRGLITTFKKVYFGFGTITALGAIACYYLGSKKS